MIFLNDKWSRMFEDSFNKLEELVYEQMIDSIIN